MQVATGLTAVHKRKLVHRDIKPNNIMVTLGAGRRGDGKNHRLELGEVPR